MDSLDPGFRIANRYEIQELIGEGGFGLVYKAFDLVIERPVAVKLLRPRGTSFDVATYEGILKRFWREAKTAGSVRNPNVVTIFDAGILGTQPYIVMEFLPGHDLKRELHGDDDHKDALGPIAPQRTLYLAAQALMGLDEVHQLGIVHKDLKPTNLFLIKAYSFHETLCILDFGMAALVEGSAERLTDAGQLAGTARYFAPEYIDQAELTATVDIYQMGLILYEMLTGKPVIDTPQVIECVRRHRDSDLRLDPLVLASPLGPVLLRALHRDPDQRFGSAREFADALLDVDPEEVPNFAQQSRTGRYRYIARQPDGSTALVAPEPLPLKARATPEPTPDPSKGLHKPERRSLKDRKGKHRHDDPESTEDAPPTPTRTSPLVFLQIAMAFLAGAALATIIAVLLR